MLLLWPDCIRHDDVIMFVAKKAGGTKKVVYSMHESHRIAEQVRVHYPNVDKLESSVNQLFLKAPSWTVFF